jgi:hypothetical protein
MSILRAARSAKAPVTDTSRRSFIWKMGAGVSAGVASVAGMAGTPSGATDDPSLRVALLEEEKAIRGVHRQFELAMDRGRYEEVVAMFADDAEVVFNGGIFRRHQGVNRLYCNVFRFGKSGGSMEQAPGFELAADQRRDHVAVSSDLVSATAAFAYSIQVGAPFETENSLASMARLHGEGVHTWWEGGVYRVAYRKDAVAGAWRMNRLEYDTLARADYRQGRSYARAIAVARFAKRFPEDQAGPDELV